MTDHASLAEGNLKLVSNHTQKSGVSAADTIAIAQVQATLALAAEQRTANLFAYLEQVREDLRKEPNPAAVAWLADQAADLRERLGLDR